MMYPALSGLGLLFTVVLLALAFISGLQMQSTVQRARNRARKKSNRKSRK